MKVTQLTNNMIISQHDFDFHMLHTHKKNYQAFDDKPAFVTYKLVNTLFSLRNHVPQYWYKMGTARLEMLGHEHNHGSINLTLALTAVCYHGNVTDDYTV